MARAAARRCCFAVGWPLSRHCSSRCRRRSSGTATVADGDTLRLGNDRIRLLGLDAPELDQTCIGAGRRAVALRARVAAGALRELVGGGDGALRDRGTGSAMAATSARCTVGGDDLGAALVAEGLAVADRRL